MLDKLKELLDKDRSEGEENIKPQVLLYKQIGKVGLLILVGAIAIGLVIVMISKKEDSRVESDGGGLTEASGAGVKIELANKALDPEKMWRNHFEDKLTDSASKLNEKLQAIEQSFTEKEQQLQAKASKELEDMKKQLYFASQELKEATEEIRLLRESTNMQRSSGVEEETRIEANFINHKLENEQNISAPKSSRSYIPETAYLQGILLGGISVSTSVSSSSEPVPVVIRITGIGNMPKNFDIDLKTCNILGSSYGDLSSERAIIRAEVMSCRDDVNEQIITTKVVGVVYGDDGANGIKGRVIQTSNKQVQHAILGGLLSGFANTAKAGEQFTLSSIGAVNTTKTPLGQRLQDNSLAGIGNAGEKIANHYLKQAESMSPVLLIPGGTKVDIVFTKGVHIGSSDIRSKIERERSANDNNGN